MKRGKGYAKSLERIMPSPRLDSTVILVLRHFLLIIMSGVDIGSCICHAIILIWPPTRLTLSYTERPGTSTYIRAVLEFLDRSIYGDLPEF